MFRHKISGPVRRFVEGGLQSARGFSPALFFVAAWAAFVGQALRLRGALSSAGNSRLSAATVLFATALVSSGCRQDMHNQPRYKPLAATDFFGDGRSARPAIPDTVARGQLRLDQARYTGKINGKDVETFPIQIAHGDVLRGQERFNIYCSPCHGRLGNGHGMIVSRGLRQPPSYLDPRLINAPVGHFFDVMTNGYGAMYSYASRVAPDDRWRIAAYIRALQLSQDAPPQVAEDYERRTEGSRSLARNTRAGGPAGGMK